MSCAISCVQIRRNAIVVIKLKLTFGTPVIFSFISVALSHWTMAVNCPNFGRRQVWYNDEEDAKDVMEKCCKASSSVTHCLFLSAHVVSRIESSSVSLLAPVDCITLSLVPFFWLFTIGNHDFECPKNHLQVPGNDGIPSMPDNTR